VSSCHTSYYLPRRVIDGARHLIQSGDLVFGLRSSVFGLRSSVFSYSRRCRRQHVGMQVAGSSRGTRYTPSPKSTGGLGVHTRSRFRRQDRRHSARTGQT